MDVTELLAHDHRMVEQLFRDYEAAASDQQRRAVVEVLIRELSKHAALEELMVYPLAKKVLPEGRADIEQHLSEHMTVKKLLVDLDKADNPRTVLDKLHGELTEHIREEEGEMFPQLRAQLDQTALDELGAAVAAAKDKAPTRPHPHAPTEPPALALAAPVAAIYDRLRDRLQGRPLT